MDGSQFDHLARRWGTRRAAIGSLIASLAGLASLDSAAKTKRKHTRPHAETRQHTPQHASVLAEKKKKKKCKGGTIKCGKKLCVNASTDASNCGACGNRCGAGQACVSGVCTSTGPGPVTCLSGQILCGGGCVDPMSDETHCGACGVRCASGETCSGGQCRAGSGYPCDTVYDCGGAFRGVKCVNHQCVCENPAEGLCSDPRLGSYANCNVCCPGGNRNCPGDKQCTGPSSPTAYCACAPDQQICNYNPPHRCSQNQATDSHRCGINCIDCVEQNGPTSFCCFGECLTACEPNKPCSLQTCSGCQTCAPGTACCRSGTSNLFGCALLVNGRCPGPPA